MTYETVKSIILTILVITSLLLTWNLWTYQPNYYKLEQLKTVKDVSLGYEKEAREIAMAEKAIFHLNNHYYGTVSEVELKLIMKEISGWDFQYFKEIPEESFDIASFMKQPNQEVIHILYPDRIMIQLFESMYGIELDRSLIFSFNQIIIRLPSTDREAGNVYFISESKEDRSIYQYTISSNDVYSFKDKFFSKVVNYDSYFLFTTQLGKLIYLPQNQTELKNYTYVIEPIEITKLKNALFNDPSLVKPNGSGEYIDAQYLLKEKQNIISYDNYAQFHNRSVDKGSIDTTNLLQKSIEFVNMHGGWTGSYRFVELNEKRKTVRFRIYENGYPVFVDDSSAAAELKINWGEGEISQYVRNNFSLPDPLPHPLKKILISGTEALDQIRQIESDNDLMNLEDLTIGYSMSINNERPSAYLEPNWFYKYKNSNWKILTIEDLGGEEDGLE